MSARDLALDVRDIWPDYRPTRLVELPTLARLARVRRVLVKMECERPLGNFKALGGMVAALRALARAAGVSRLRNLRSNVSHSHDVGAASRPTARGASVAGELRLPNLVCASAGNHGLAVAAAARWAGTRATVYLAESASRERAARIEALGARVVWTPGTYDDAVERAANAEGLLIADTSPDPDDQVVRDVMDGYGLISRELAAQLSDNSAPERGDGPAVPLGDATALSRGLCSSAGRTELSADGPTHLFVQAGVGGLAATLAGGLRHLMRGPRRVLVVEPQAAACVAAALAAGEPVRVAGALSTEAEMLACGLASAPAVKILREHDARPVVVAEALLQEAAMQLQDLARIQDVARSRDVDALRAGAAEASGRAGPLTGPTSTAGRSGSLTTSSGATGLAGLLQVSSNGELRELHQLDEESCVLLVITEGALPSTATIFGTS